MDLLLEVLFIVRFLRVRGVPPPSNLHRRRWEIFYATLREQTHNGMVIAGLLGLIHATCAEDSLDPWKGLDD